MPEILRILQVVVGIGLVIFVHELGHFLAARWCGVRVHVFSLGFGPKLFGVVRGGVLYQVAAIPIGGYVAMAGEGPREQGRPPRPDDLASKSVGQRFLVYSGGVLMNVAFALVVFPILFLNGVPFTDTIVSAVPGQPAWRAGIEDGSRVITINGRKVYEFDQILSEVALGGADPVRLEVLGPGDVESRDLVVRPERDDSAGFFRLGLRPAVDAEHRLGVDPDGAAYAAGLRDEARLLRVVGAPAELDLADQLQLAYATREAIELEVLAPDAEDPRRVTVEPVARSRGERPRLGIAPVANLVVAVRPDPALEALGIREGDRILSLYERRLAAGSDFLLALEAASGPLRAVVARDGRRLELEGPELSTAERFALRDTLAIGLDLDGTAVTVAPGEAAARGGMLDGDRILSIGGENVVGWEQVSLAVKAHAERNRAMEIEVERTDAEGERRLLSFELAVAEPEPLDYGFGLAIGSEYVFRTSGPLEAVKVGFQASIRMLQDGWLTLKRMILAEVSTKNIGGIISISYVSYSFSESGLAKLFYFLCLLSVNLAFVNVLPIPLLDGGHLLFLLVEKLKGSPVSERVLGYSQMVGLVLLVGLMVYVTYNDLLRVVFRG